MIRPVVLAALLSVGVQTAAGAADSGQVAAPGQSAPEVAQPAPAGILTELSAEEVAEMIRDAGYKAEVKVDNSNLPYVSSLASGLNYWINFYGCEGEPPRCIDIEFQTSFETTAEQQQKAEQWSADKVFGRPYTIDNSTYFALPVRINGGVTAENVFSTLDLWDRLLDDFTTYIGW